MTEKPKLVQDDPWLEPHQGVIERRMEQFSEALAEIEKNSKSLAAYATGHKYVGIHFQPAANKWAVREWAPAAQSVSLIGDFNHWDREAHPLALAKGGIWSLELPGDALAHGQKVKLHIVGADGSRRDRIPACIRRALQDPTTHDYCGQIWNPPHPYAWKYEFNPASVTAPLIYESHVGMAGEEPRIHTYREFAETVLPRIAKAGYNTVQLMAVQEHAYYASFGYHVTNFFGVSSRSGNPDDLKYLVDTAHGLGLRVLLDIVHSHASSNADDGLNGFDFGQESSGSYFHSGARGYHTQWDSRCFRYDNWEVQRFLLSNVRYWMTEYKFDGFRFDGVTSMLYTHHGINRSFSGNYAEYFGTETDVDAVVYLMLANDLAHRVNPEATVLAEDVSGMPTLCRPVTEGGIGFDGRLAMAVPDHWIKLLKEKPDEAWNMHELVCTLCNRRYSERSIAYAESHDQALVGDKTIAFWLMDRAMYDGMSTTQPASPVVARGVALHKVIRAITAALGGEGYLNFMGNEFGHPEWVDFPRTDSIDPSTGATVPGNGGSHDKCRRRWDLADADFLKYRFMNAFDAAMQHLDKAYGFVASPHEWVSRKAEGDKLVVVERGDLVFVFNFHPSSSFTDYRVGTPAPGEYKIVLSSDEKVFGGWANASKDAGASFAARDDAPHDGRPASMQVYAPARTVVAYAPAAWADKDGDRKVGGIPGLGVKGTGPYFAV